MPPIMATILQDKKLVSWSAAIPSTAIRTRALHCTKCEIINLVTLLDQQGSDYLLYVLRQEIAFEGHTTQGSLQLQGDAEYKNNNLLRVSYICDGWKLDKFAVR